MRFFSTQPTDVLSAHPTASKTLQTESVLQENRGKQQWSPQSHVSGREQDPGNPRHCKQRGSKGVMRIHLMGEVIRICILCSCGEKLRRSHIGRWEKSSLLSYGKRTGPIALCLKNSTRISDAVLRSASSLWCWAPGSTFCLDGLPR